MDPTDLAAMEVDVAVRTAALDRLGKRLLELDAAVTIASLRSNEAEATGGLGSACWNLTQRSQSRLYVHRRASQGSFPGPAEFGVQ